MPLDGADILRVIQQIMQDTNNAQQHDRRRAQALAQQQQQRRALHDFWVHCDASTDHERGIHGEIIKPVTEAEIVASETNTPTQPPGKT